MAATIASKLSAAAALGATTAVPQRRRAGQQHAQRVPPTDLTRINQRLLWLRAAASISLTPPAAALMTQLVLCQLQQVLCHVVAHLLRQLSSHISGLPEQLHLGHSERVSLKRAVAPKHVLKMALRLTAVRPSMV